MHFMTESASVRSRRRAETEHRIAVCAQRLTDEVGLDGFTMDDLAAAADVSRRTLFNYFPGKIDAVLGNTPDLSPASVETFVKGGPHGHVVDDLGELASTFLESKVLTQQEMDRARRVVIADHRLTTAVHERFEQLTGELVDLILAREGQAFGADRARLLIRLLVAVYDGCVTTVAEGRDLGVPLAEVFTQTLTTARQILA
jgi:AcrR family transcriptional regulator